MSRAKGRNPVLATNRVRRRRAGTQEKLENLLSVTAGLIARRGYSQTAIRDVGRETGTSLPGMYYYFKSKEDLLFQIQHRSFSSLIESQERVLAQGGTPQERLRRLVIGHLSFFSQHPNEMKVCTFELESLRGKAYGTVEQLRRDYYKMMFNVIDDMLEHAGRRDPGGLTTRHITLFVFGMLNWIFMWFDPERDAPVERLGDKMIDLLMHGLVRPEPRT